MPDWVLWTLAGIGGLLLFLTGIIAGIALVAPRWRP